MQEILVFKFKALNERIIRDAMEVIWEFPGVTSVEVKGDADQLEVNGGEFSKIVMAAKLKDIDESVSFIIKAGPDVEAPNNATSYGTNSKIKDALSAFRAPKPAPPPPPEPTYARGRGKSFNHDQFIKPQQPILNAVAAGVRNFMYKPNPNQLAEINWGKKPKPEVKHQEQGGLFGYFGKKQQPQKEKHVREIPKPQSTASTSKKGTNTELRCTFCLVD
ncbi:Heavy metal-associated domain HMA [Arabidopsis thaliana x Arabidopsis arenosa]|uniref:Heavy metal-associated domain HMA n=1 Tax=Arabidopsis thaliana x Arabidopsis arenosa TaxID=1240361 RepID=A0A8T1XMZ4_9BRAS|nr:Heavy metal-associated domain HMA [Arabidopsis thaliana x Arabidopsis arenosa]